MRRVAITGMGAVSPYGKGVKALLEGIREARSAVVPMEEWRGIRGLGSKVAAPVPPLDFKRLLPRSVRRGSGLMALFGVLAAEEAVADSGLTSGELASSRTGVAMGSTTGSPGTYEEFYREYLPDQEMEGVKSGLFFKIMGHTCSAAVCQHLGVQGHQWAPSSACTSSAQAMGLGFIMIRHGLQDLMLCGGSDETHPTVTMVFDVLQAASRSWNRERPTPRPFDRHRDGVVCGGGAGVLLLEEMEQAKRRGARIYGEIRGFGLVNDNSHVANPSHRAMSAAMSAALQDGSRSPGEIDYVNAHATGTIRGDLAEAKAVSAVFGREVPLSSLKGHMGHTLGASGVLETIVVLDMIMNSVIYPTLNLFDPDPLLPELNLVQETRSLEVNRVLKNNFALGGVNTSLLIERVGINE